MRRNRPLSVVIGAGRPEYREELELDIGKITETQLKELWERLTERFRDNDSAEWSEAGRRWCAENGIFRGDSSDAPNFQWEAPVTREQLAVTLHRFAQLIGRA
jgi:hypothetical protein